MVKKKYIQVSILALTIIIGSVLNYSMSIAIVSMTNQNSTNSNFQVIKINNLYKGLTFLNLSQAYF